MSLVNDMLRDLDQRRKDSSNGVSAADLSPAPEAIKETKNRFPLYLASVLVLIAGGLGLAWYLLSNGNTEQPLNIRPDNIPTLVNEESIPVVPQQPVDDQQSSQPDAIAAQPTNSGRVTVAAEDNAPLTEIPEEPAIDDQANSGNVEIADAQPVLEQSVEQQPADQQEPEDITTTTVADQETGEAPDLAEESVPDITVPVGEQGLAVAESIKNEVELTPEEQDMAAVQEALRLIADNRMTDAFDALENEIESNRYAHQSRETYAKLLFSQGDIPGAERVVDEGLQLAPNHPGFKKVKARLLLNESEVNSAVELLISRAPEVAMDAEYHDILASSQLANRDYQGASLSYTSLVQHDPSQGKWWYGFAASQDRLGNTRAARQAYTRAMQQPNLSANLRRRSQERLTQLGP